MSGHTPGPWHAREWSCHGPTTVGIGDLSNFQLVAECSGSPFSDPVTDANASLIAAAPELLDAAKRLMEYYAHCLPDHMTNEFRGVIAKSEGRS